MTMIRAVSPVISSKVIFEPPKTEKGGEAFLEGKAGGRNLPPKKIPVLAHA
jgi:hypothetical protein